MVFLVFPNHDKTKNKTILFNLILQILISGHFILVFFLNNTNRNNLLVDQPLFNMVDKSIKEGVWIEDRRGSSKRTGQQVRHHSLGHLGKCVDIFGPP